MGGESWTKSFEKPRTDCPRVKQTSPPSPEFVVQNQFCLVDLSDTMAGPHTGLLWGQSSRGKQIYRIAQSGAPKSGEEKSRKWNSLLAKGKRWGRSSLSSPSLFSLCTLLLVWPCRTPRGNFLSLSFSSCLPARLPHREVHYHSGMTTKRVAQLNQSRNVE